jgi:translation elongation factor EF-4
VVYIDKEVFISNPTEFPEVTDTSNKVKEIQEPVVKASIIAPEGDSIPYFDSLTDM